MTARPRVSICIPVRNRASFIADCLDSTREDDGHAIEVVVLDDGSTDGTDAVVRDWMARNPSRRVRFERQPPLGIPRSCNRLVEMAEGETIAWLGSDDLLLKGGLAARLAYLSSHPEKLAVFGDARVIDGAGRPLFESVYAGLRRVDTRLFRTDDTLRRTLLSRWCVPQPVLLVRREIYDRLGRYDESFETEDYDFYLRMLAHGAIGYVDAFVSAYRLHAQNTSLHPATRPAMMRQFFRAARKNRAAFPPWEQALMLGFGAAVAIKGVALGWRRAHA